jgi:acetyl-CoA carboxylase carboxyl transferase subunit beta
MQQGAIVMIVDRRKLREEIAQLMALMTRQPADSVA